MTKDKGDDEGEGGEFGTAHSTSEPSSTAPCANCVVRNVRRPHNSLIGFKKSFLDQMQLSNIWNRHDIKVVLENIILIILIKMGKIVLLVVVS